MQRTPGMYTAINTQTQRTGLPTQDHRIVFVTGDTAAPLNPTPIYDTATANVVSGANSNAGRMIAAALSVSQGVRVETVGKGKGSSVLKPNYINLTEPPVVASSIRFEDGYDVAACLKVQVNDGAPQINSFLAKPAVLTHASVTPDQVALSKLLQSFARGRFPWGSGDLFMSETFTVSAFAVLPETIGDSIPQSFALAGLDDDLLKSAIAYMFSEDPSIDLSPLASMPVSQLQSWIDATALPTGLTSMTINNTPSKITISRTTQTEIDGLFRGDHLPHVDMFDVAKSLLTSQHVELNSRGFEPAKYIADRDVIELVSNYSLTIKLGVMELEPVLPT